MLSSQQGIRWVHIYIYFWFFCSPNIKVLEAKFKANETLILSVYGYNDLLTHWNLDLSKLDSLKFSCLSTLLENMKVFFLVDEGAETQFSACLFFFSVSLSPPSPHTYPCSFWHTHVCSHRERAQPQLRESLEGGVCSFSSRLMSYLTGTWRWFNSIFFSNVVWSGICRSLFLALSFGFCNMLTACAFCNAFFHYHGNH